jgi:hypothetical protein
VTEQIARPATLEDLKSLLRSLDANAVDYLLIGGYALAAHGYQRARQRGAHDSARSGGEGT